MTLGACGGAENSGSGAADDGRPAIVATSTILANWATELVGDQAQVIGLLKPGDDPHVYEPVPQDSRALEEADLIVYNGYNLEPQLIRLMRSAGATVPQVAIAEVVTPLSTDYNGATVPDPHVWGDARNAIAMVERLEGAIADQFPALGDRVETHGAKLVKTLEALHRWIRAQIATIPEGQRRLVTSHDAFQYYASAYGIPVAGTLIGISTEEQPSARTVESLASAIRAASIPTIFAETTVNPALLKTVAAEAGVTLADRELYADSVGAPGSGAETYVMMMVANTRAIVEGLGGRYEPFVDPAIAENSPR
ncbi:MAG: zinc ABC transporter substrate-binding protein [Cyanophyceae cyanobacterium]